MATLTQTHVLVCDNASEYASAVSKLDTYQADSNNTPLDSRTDDEPNLTITYSVVSSISP